MLKLFIATLFLIVVMECHAQQGVDSLFIVTYTTGAKWDNSKKPQEQTYFKEHSINLSTMRKNGVIKLGARYSEKGIIIITAASFKAAQELINSDQAVVNSLFKAEVEKLNVFYDGCIEKKVVTTKKE
jgi:hypothetical protein